MKRNLAYGISALFIWLTPLLSPFGNAAEPVKIGEWKSLYYGTMDLDLAGDLIYLANGFAGLEIVNVSNPASPQLVGHYGSGGFVRAVAVSGNRALILTDPSTGEESAEMQILDISDPAAPAFLGRLLASAFPQARGFRDVAWRQGQGVVSVFKPAGGVVTLNVSDPANIKPEKTYSAWNTTSAPISYSRLTVEGSEIFFTVTGPIVVGPWPALYNTISNTAVWGANQNIIAAAVTNGIAFLANAFSGFDVVNVRGPHGTATRLGSVPLGRDIGDVAVSGDYAAMGGTNKVSFINVTSLTNPTLAGIYPMLVAPSRLTMRGFLAFIGDPVNGLSIVDFSSIALPSIRIKFLNGTLTLELSGKPGAMAQIEYCDDPRFTTEVQPLGTPIQLTDGLVAVPVPWTVEIPRRFFRLRIL